MYHRLHLQQQDNVLRHEPSLAENKMFLKIPCWGHYNNGWPRWCYAKQTRKTQIHPRIGCELSILLVWLEALHPVGKIKQHVTWFRWVDVWFSGFLEESCMRMTVGSLCFMTPQKKRNVICLLFGWLFCLISGTGKSNSNRLKTGSFKVACWIIKCRQFSRTNVRDVQIS